MKKLLPLLLFLFTAISSTAQTEIVFPYSDSTLSVVNVSSLVDESGNLYVLSSLYLHQEFPLSDWDGNEGLLVTKLNRQNDIVWQKTFPGEFMNDGLNNMCVGKISNAQFYLGNGELVIPCENGVSSVCRMPTLKNGMLAIGTQNGTVFSNNLFSDEAGCGDMYMDACANYGNGRYAYIYNFRDSTNGAWLDIRDVHGNNLLNTYIGAFGRSYLKNITYNTTAKNWEGFDSSSVFICDSLGRLLHQYPMPVSGTPQQIRPYEIAANAGYFLLYYGEENYSTDEETYDIAVYTASGELISFKSYPQPFSTLTLTDDNYIWTATTAPSSYYNTDKPITLSQMDLFQSLIRTTSIGVGLTGANNITVKNNEVIVTGVHVSDNNSPNRLYLYRQYVNDVPLAPQAFTHCKDVSLYPNPVSGTLSLSSRDFNSTHNASVSLFNAVGQQLGFYTWQQQKLDINMSSYPAGIYVVHISNPAAHKDCVDKVIKE